ncbi:hypothetical protein [Streptomyces sp. OE57]|uniref:hypothetical protein n=1 Tax=Streptomyces lacaronensis TaxID=3379885 RepID=UPI0039B72EA7
MPGPICSLTGAHVERAHAVLPRHHSQLNQATTPHHLALDYAVLVLAAAAGITAASSLLGRLAR